jgi:hypothetical protein
VLAEIGYVVRRVTERSVEVVGSPVVACVSCDRGGCSLLRRARQREKVLSVGVIGSSVASCIVCVVVTASVVDR